jgi:hypothetical protein
MMMLEPAANAVFAPQPAPADYIEAARIPLLLRPKVFRPTPRTWSACTPSWPARARVRRDPGPDRIISGAADTIVWTNLHSRSLEREIPGAKLIVLPASVTCRISRPPTRWRRRLPP